MMEIKEQPSKKQYGAPTLKCLGDIVELTQKAGQDRTDVPQGTPVDGDISAPDKQRLSDLHFSIRSTGPSASAIGRLLGIDGQSYTFYSLGPNGADEGGAGDDPATSWP